MYFTIIYLKIRRKKNILITILENKRVVHFFLINKIHIIHRHYHFIFKMIMYTIKN